MSMGKIFQIKSACFAEISAIYRFLPITQQNCEKKMLIFEFNRRFFDKISAKNCLSFGAAQSKLEGKKFKF